MLQRIAENLADVRQRIAAAAGASGRPADAVRLIAVTKYVSDEAARALVEAGCRDLGESRPQELWRKSTALSDLEIRWHMIGHLQRNKIGRTLPLAWMIHSLDSLRLAEALDAAARDAGLRSRALLEVNVSGDASKHGFGPDELLSQWESVAQLPNVEILGLMGMASREGDLPQARRDFANLRQLRDRLRAASNGSLELDELSMGMSGDFEAAIAEGGTMVRIGSALVEGCG
jgi:PLP dependent protein